MTGRASTNGSQASQTRLSWHKWTGQWNWINAFIAICGVMAGIVALWAAVKGLMLQLWTSRKDFYEFCLAQQSAQKNISVACVETLQSIIPPPPSRVRLHRRWLPEYSQSSAYSIIIYKREVDFLLAAFIVVGLILFSSGILMFVHLMKGTEFATISINMKYLVLGRARSARMRLFESRKELNFLELAPSKMLSEGNISHKVSGLIGTPSKDQGPHSTSIADDHYLATLPQKIVYEVCRVLYDYTPETLVPGLDISVKAGDLVTIITKMDPEGNSTGWWGCRTSSGLYGYLPRHCLQHQAWSLNLGAGGTQLNASGKSTVSSATASASVLVSGTGPNNSTEVTGLRKRNMRNTAKDRNLSEDIDPIKPTIPVDRLSTAKLLLKMAASNDVANATYNAAIMEAARQGYDSVLVFLRNIKPHVRGAGAENAVPLWAVMKNDQETVLERLLDGEIDADAFLRGQMVSIIHTSKGNPRSFARPTVEAGADVNFADDRGRTPLMVMAEIGQVAAVELLLGKGAIINMLDSNGWSAIDYARYGGHLKALGLLEHRKGELDD